jgi:hypothetical protein
VAYSAEFGGLLAGFRGLSGPSGKTLGRSAEKALRAVSFSATLTGVTVRVVAAASIPLLERLREAAA